jgi:hypothetical protein
MLQSAIGAANWFCENPKRCRGAADPQRYSSAPYRRRFQASVA